MYACWVYSIEHLFFFFLLVLLWIDLPIVHLACFTFRSSIWGSTRAFEKLRAVLKAPQLCLWTSDCIHRTSLFLCSSSDVFDFLVFFFFAHRLYYHFYFSSPSRRSFASLCVRFFCCFTLFRLYMVRCYWVQCRFFFFPLLLLIARRALPNSAERPFTSLNFEQPCLPFKSS